MSHLLLIKHSLPEVLPDIPAKQWHLSEEGYLHCKALAEKTACYKPDIIVSSVEPKAVETATILSEVLGVSVEIVKGLHEHERDQVGFLGNAEFEASVAAFFAYPDEPVFGQETATQALARFLHAVKDVVVGHKDETVAIVAHGTVISLFIAHYTSLSAFALWKSLGLPSFVVLSLPTYKVLTIVEQVATHYR